MATILHEKGMNVIIHYHHSQREATNLCNLLNKKRTRSAIALSADLTDLSAIKTLCRAAFSEWQRINVLINNASRFLKTNMGRVSEKTWENLLNTNLKAPFFLAQTLYPYLTKDAGCIINILDIHGRRPMKDYTVYCISKAGLNMLTQSLAREFAPKVRVNSISPGQILWPEHKNTLSPKIKNSLLQRIALKRQGHPEDIAKAAYFLIEDAAYITGQDITVDGGRMLYT